MKRTRTETATIVAWIVALLGTVFGSCSAMATLKYSLDEREAVVEATAAEAADEDVVDDNVPCRLYVELLVERAIPVTGESVELQRSNGEAPERSRDGLLIPVRSTRHVAVLVPDDADLTELEGRQQLLGMFQWDVYFTDFGHGEDLPFDPDARIFSRVDPRQLAAGEADFAWWFMVVLYGAGLVGWVFAIPLAFRLRRERAAARTPG